MTQNKLLTDAELVTPPISPTPVVNQTFADWINENHQPIRSITYDQDFSDLNFLTDMIGQRSIVQLGESSHGTREFNHVKTRLVKYLHQEMGFTVLAFESGFFEGVYADSIRDTGTTDSLLRFPFGVWATDEVFEVFQYVKETQSTSSPMRLAGFDTQISSNYYARLPDFVLGVDETDTFDAELKTSLSSDFRRFRELQIEYSTNQCFLATNVNNAACSEISNAQLLIQDRFNEAADRLSNISNPTRDLKIMSIACFAASAQIDKAKAERDQQDAGSVRDKNMATLVQNLRDDLFPNEKMIIWAHNRHIAYEQSETRPVTFGVDVPMGFHLKIVNPDDIFSIGLFMLRGETADNNAMPLPVVTPRNNSLEAIAYTVRKAALYVDTRPNQTQVDGNAFLFNYTEANIWGGTFGAFEMIPSDQFDGLLFIDKSNLPSYR